MHWKASRRVVFIFLFVLGGGMLSACSTVAEDAGHGHDTEANVLTLPGLETAVLDGRPLRVVATTSIIGDVVAQVGGDAIQLTTLIGAGQDAHSYQPGAQDLTAVANADIIFINGWDLEENLIENLENIGQDVPIVPISAGITPITSSEEDHHGADPHVWLDIENVAQWVTNVETVLIALDPANKAVYEQRATAYRMELAELRAFADAQMKAVPPENRFLVTNHDSLSYFAAAYDFNVIGTVIPSVSTLSEPSANDLADLLWKMQAHQVCTIFTETAVSDKLAQTVAAELDSCSQIEVLPIYTDSIGLAGSGADSYIHLMQSNIATISKGLSAETQ